MVWVLVIQAVLFQLVDSAYALAHDQASLILIVYGISTGDITVRTGAGRFLVMAFRVGLFILFSVFLFYLLEHKRESERAALKEILLKEKMQIAISNNTDGPDRVEYLVEAFQRGEKPEMSFLEKILFKLRMYSAIRYLHSRRKRIISRKVKGMKFLLIFFYSKGKHLNDDYSYTEISW
jgi:hypothetical protein